MNEVHQGGLTIVILDGLAKSQKIHVFVIPAKAGIQGYQEVTIPLDPGFHRGDDFLRARRRAQHERETFPQSIEGLLAICPFAGDVV